MIKIRNSRGPKIDPWGTPYLIGRRDDSVLPNFTNCNRASKYDEKKLKKLSLNPNLASLRNNILWSTESKAFARSRKIAQELSFLFKLLKSFSKRSRIWT